MDAVGDKVGNPYDKEDFYENKKKNVRPYTGYCTGDVNYGNPGICSSENKRVCRISYDKCQ